jgi:hypothetical protein
MTTELHPSAITAIMNWIVETNTQNKIEGNYGTMHIEKPLESSSIEDISIPKFITLDVNTAIKLTNNPKVHFLR